MILFSGWANHLGADEEADALEPAEGVDAPGRAQGEAGCGTRAEVGALHQLCDPPQDSAAWAPFMHDPCFPLGRRDSKRANHALGERERIASNCLVDHLGEARPPAE